LLKNASTVSQQPYSLLAVSLGAPLDYKRHTKNEFLYAYLTSKVIYQIGGESRHDQLTDFPQM